ncbi:hypothetical protein Efla_007524 [Eimeria flavescens]
MQRRCASLEAPPAGPPIPGLLIRVLFFAAAFASCLDLRVEAFRGNGGAADGVWGRSSTRLEAYSLEPSALSLGVPSSPLMQGTQVPAVGAAAGWAPEPETEAAAGAPPLGTERQENSELQAGGLTTEKDAAAARLLDASLNAVGSQQFPISLATELGKDSTKQARPGTSNRIAGVLTPKIFREELKRAIDEHLVAFPGTTPVIRARWHKSEQYVAAAASLLDDRGMSFCFIVLAEYAAVTTQRPGNILSATALALIPATQESLVDEEGSAIPYPFILPTSLQLLKSAFGEEYAATQLGLSPADKAEADLHAISAKEEKETNAAEAGELARKPYRERQFRKTASPFLRWVPFGLTRRMTSSATSGRKDADAGRLKGIKKSQKGLKRENEQLFVEALSRELPHKWIEAPDGRRVVVVLSDRIAECRTLLDLSLKRSHGGTPVFLEDAEGTTARKMLLRLRDDRIDGEKIAFVVLAIGNAWQVPLSFAFFDRAVLRVPKADDIKEFLERKQDEVEAAWNEESQELAELREHLSRRRQHLLELAGDQRAAAPPSSASSSESQQQTREQIAITTAGGTEAVELPSSATGGASFLVAETDESQPTDEQATEEEEEHPYLFRSRTPEEAPVFILNPFDEYILRFNYTEVSDVRSYAEALAFELQNVPLAMAIRGETHRVAIMILADPPDTEAELGQVWAKLDRIIHVAIAAAMIVALLCCLCMWRLMHLLKQR